MNRTEKIDCVREWLRWVMGDGGDQLLEEILEGSTSKQASDGSVTMAYYTLPLSVLAVSDLDDDGSLDALCRLMEHSTTRREDLKLIMDFQVQILLVLTTKSAQFAPKLHFSIEFAISLGVS